MSDPTRPRLDAAELAALDKKTEAAVALLERIAREHAPAALASSLGAEDMVLTDLIARHAPSIDLFVLDTGRLHEETYALIARVEAHYGLRLQLFAPQAEDVEAFVARHGINGFYDSLEARLACCDARKVRPLARALAGKRAWITGMRREQSPTRSDLPQQQWDEVHGLAKFNPLADWSARDVWAYLRHHGVPFHPLHERFYPSIGCAPCTRAVAVGEDPRAGRWWWERPEHKECGLHRRPVLTGETR